METELLNWLQQRIAEIKDSNPHATIIKETLLEVIDVIHKLDQYRVCANCKYIKSEKIKDEFTEVIIGEMNGCKLHNFIHIKWDITKFGCNGFKEKE